MPSGKKNSASVNLQFKYRFSRIRNGGPKINHNSGIQYLTLSVSDWKQFCVARFYFFSREHLLEKSFDVFFLAGDSNDTNTRVSVSGCYCYDW